MADDVSLVYLSTASTILRFSSPSPVVWPGLPLLLNHPLLPCSLSLSLSLPLFRGNPTTEECHAGLTRCICLSRALHAAEKEPSSSPLCKAGRDG